MKAKDIMTTNVVTLSPGNSIKRAAQIMLDCNVTGLPVLDDEHHLIGIISQGDLLRRKELGAGRFPASGRPVASSEDRAGAYVKRHSWKVGDVMTTTVVAVEEDMSIDQVAALLDEHRIKRVPVMRRGKLVGIISRRDLLRAIAIARPEDNAAGDTAIQRCILTRLGEDAGLAGARLSVTVSNGLVHVWGTVGSETERDAARVVAEGVRGVIGVADHLRVVPALGARRHQSRTA